MYINWDSNVYVNGVEEPVYGNYGGFGYSNWGNAPVDSLDTLFYNHDLAYTSGTDVTSADHTLLNGMVALSDSQLVAGGDTEAALYAGFAELGMIGKLVTEGYHFSFWELSRDVSDAYHNIQIGLSGLNSTESASLQNWLVETGGTLLL